MLTRDGKLFGRISVIDLLAILAVIVLIFGIRMRFSDTGEVPSAAGEPTECVVEVKNIRQYNVDALKKGGQVYDRTTHEWSDVREDYFWEFQEKKKQMMGKEYRSPIRI